MVRVTLSMCILAKSPKSSAVSADACSERYMLISFGFKGTLIPYGGTEKKVDVCIIGLILLPNNSRLMTTFSFRNTVCCAISLRRKSMVEMMKSSRLLASFRSLNLRLHQRTSFFLRRQA